VPVGVEFPENIDYSVVNIIQMLRGLPSLGGLVETRPAEESLRPAGRVSRFPIERLDACRTKEGKFEFFCTVAIGERERQARKASHGGTRQHYS